MDEIQAPEASKEKKKRQRQELPPGSAHGGSSACRPAI